MFNHSGRKSFYLWADCAAVRKTEACQAGWVCPEPRACGGGCAGPPCGERERDIKRSRGICHAGLAEADAGK